MHKSDVYAFNPTGNYVVHNCTIKYMNRMCVEKNYRRVTLILSYTIIAV